MNEHRKDVLSREEERVLELLDAGGDPWPVEEVESKGLRQYREVLGLIPGTLAEAQPRADVKARILVAIGKDESPREPLAGSPATFSLKAPRWFLPLAASVAFAMIAVTGWLVVQVQGQRGQIAQLSSELESAKSLTGALEAAQGMLAEARSRLAMVSSEGTEFCALKPPAGSPALAARGVVVMQKGQDDWFLRVEGLEPCPRGHKYAVWFATDAGAVAGPVFEVEAGEAIELTVTDRPAKINAIMITLESDPAPTAPSMNPLLFGDERIQLL